MHTSAPTSPMLPPHGTPTLPETTTTPSGLIVPKSPSGLIIVRNELSQVSAGSALVVPSAPIHGDGALAAAKAAHAELATAKGAPAADILLGREVELATQVRNDEIRQQAIAAFLAGDLATATKLLAGSH